MTLRWRGPWTIATSCGSTSPFGWCGALGFPESPKGSRCLHDGSLTRIQIPKTERRFCSHRDRRLDYSVVFSRQLGVESGTPLLRLRAERNEEAVDIRGLEQHAIPASQVSADKTEGTTAETAWEVQACDYTSRSTWIAETSLSRP